MLRGFWNDCSGAIVSAEIVLVLTIAVLGVIVGLSEVAVSVNTELNDISNALGRLDQTYAYTGFRSSDNGKLKSYTAGGNYEDSTDDGDLNGTCDIVCGYSSSYGERSF